MKKTAAALLFLSSVAIGMEENKLSMSSSPYSGRAKGYVPQKIAELRAARKKLDAKVEVQKVENIYHLGGLEILSIPGRRNISSVSIYYGDGTSCYSFKFLYEKKTEGPIKAKSMKIEGYGLIALVLAVPALERTMKIQMVESLLYKEKFIATKKDLNLAYLDLWERTQEDSTRKALLCFGSKDKSSILSYLSFDLIKLIAQFIEPAEKPLLPRNFFENGIVKIQSIEGEE